MSVALFVAWIIWNLFELLFLAKVTANTDKINNLLFVFF